MAGAVASVRLGWWFRLNDRGIYVTFYSVYYYIILDIFLLYISYLFSFLYFVGFGSE